MKKFLLPLVGAAALAAPTSALAWGTHHHHFGFRFAFFARIGDRDGDHDNALFAKLSGTGSSFADSSATATGSIVAGNDHPNGHFNVSISTNWSQAQSKTFTEEDGDTVTISCAPATASSTLSNGSTSTANLTGKTCSKTDEGKTKYGFFGHTLDGKTHLFLKEDGTTVHGFEFSWR